MDETYPVDMIRLTEVYTGKACYVKPGIIAATVPIVNGGTTVWLDDAPPMMASHDQVRRSLYVSETPDEIQDLREAFWARRKSLQAATADIGG